MRGLPALPGGDEAADAGGEAADRVVIKAKLKCGKLKVEIGKGTDVQPRRGRGVRSIRYG